MKTAEKIFRVAGLVVAESVLVPLMIAETSTIWVLECLLFGSREPLLWTACMKTEDFFNRTETKTERHGQIFENNG